MSVVIVTSILGIVAILFSICLVWNVVRKEKGTSEMIKIHDAIKEGAIAFLKRQYKTIFVFITAITAVVDVIFGLLAAVSFATGAVLSALASYLGMLIAIHSNIRTAQSARKGLNEALTTAYYGGTAIGILLTGLGLLSVGLLYQAGDGQPSQIVAIIFGASLTALFGRIGGGVYAKAADMGADLVGKLEIHVPEDDPYNPAVIADQVGDNVGDIAGTGSDVYQSYVSALVSAMIIGLSSGKGYAGLYYPVAVLAAGLVSSIMATFIIRLQAKNARSAINRVMYFSAALVSVSSSIISWVLFGNFIVFYAVLTGILTVILWASLTEHFTSVCRSPVKMIARSAQTGPATNILAGFSIGLESTAFPTLILCSVVFVAFYLCGVYGVVMVTIGFLSVAATLISMSGYGPIVDNAGGIIEMSGVNSESKNVTEELDAVGNTNKAICKGYAVGTSVLAQIVMLLAYIDQIHISSLNVIKPQVIIGLLIGSMISFVFGSLMIRAVGKAAFLMIREVRRQFNEIPGLREKKAKPDYAYCVDISTKKALKGLLAPSLISIIVPLTVGFMLGSEAYVGFIMGNLVSVLLLALVFTNSGTAWDNAKKLIESEFVQRGGPTHTAAVIGDTVGDSLKDAVGPSLDILINIIGGIGLLFAPWFVAYAIFA